MRKILILVLLFLSVSGFGQIQNNNIFLNSDLNVNDILLKIDNTSNLYCIRTIIWRDPPQGWTLNDGFIKLQIFKKDINKKYKYFLNFSNQNELNKYNIFLKTQTDTFKLYLISDKGHDHDKSILNIRDNTIAYHLYNSNNLKIGQVTSYLGGADTIKSKVYKRNKN